MKNLPKQYTSTNKCALTENEMQVNVTSINERMYNNILAVRDLNNQAFERCVDGYLSLDMDDFFEDYELYRSTSNVIDALLARIDAALW